jgi:hypothetical protein
VPVLPGAHHAGRGTLEGFRVSFGHAEQQRDRAVEQAGQRRGRRVRIRTVVRVLGLAGNWRAQLVDAGQQRRPRDAGQAAAALAGDERGDVHCAGRVARDHDLRRIAAVARDVLPDPGDRGGHILRSGGPHVLGRQPVGHRHADPAIAHRPRPDKVISRGPWVVLVAANEPAAMDEQEDRGSGLGSACAVHVEAVPRVIPVAQVTVDPGRGVADLLVERRKQRPRGLRQFRRDRRAQLLELHDHVRRQVLRLPVGRNQPGHDPNTLRCCSSSESGIQLPWKPIGTRCGMWIVATGPALRSCACRMTTSEVLVVMSLT